MKTIASKLLMSVFAVLTVSVAEARSRCDVEYYSNGYFYVTRNSGVMSGAYTSLAAAVSERNQMVYQRLCVARPAYESSCDVQRHSNGYFYATRNGAIMSGAYSSSSNAIQARNERIRSRLCVARDPRESRCDVQRYSNGYFYVTRNGSIASGAYSNIQNAIEERNKFVSAGMCRLR